MGSMMPSDEPRGNQAISDPACAAPAGSLRPCRPLMLAQKCAALSHLTEGLGEYFLRGFCKYSRVYVYFPAYAATKNCSFSD